MDHNISNGHSPPPSHPVEILTPDQVALLFTVKVCTVYSWVYRDEITQIPYFKLGNLLRFYKHEVIAWFTRHRRR